MSNVAIMNVATLMKSNQAKLTFSKDTKMEDRNQFKATLSTITQQQNEQRKSVREKSQNVEPGTKEVKKNEQSNDKVNDVLKRLDFENSKVKAKARNLEEASGKLNENLSMEVSQVDKKVELDAESEEKFLNQVAELLQMTTEQLQQMLEKLQLNISDLFDVNHVMALLMEKMDFSDTTDLLLANDVTDILSQVNKLVISHFAPSDSNRKEAFNQDLVGEDLKNQSQANLEQSGMNKGTNPVSTIIASSNGNSQTFNEADTMNLGMDQQEDTSSTPLTKSSSAFEGILSQVITQKSETIVMKGEIQTITTEVTAKDIFDQIVTAIKVNKTDQSQEVTLQLNPKHLGKVQVSLLHENGGITGKFIVENESVKELMENGMAALKEHLKAQGIEVTDLKISVKDTRSYFSNQDHQQQAQQQFNRKSSRNMNFKSFENEVKDMEVSSVSEINHVNESSSIELQA